MQERQGSQLYFPRGQKMPYLDEDLRLKTARVSATHKPDYGGYGLPVPKPPLGSYGRELGLSLYHPEGRFSGELRLGLQRAGGPHIREPEQSPSLRVAAYNTQPGLNRYQLWGASSSDLGMSLRHWETNRERGPDEQRGWTFSSSLNLNSFTAVDRSRNRSPLEMGQTRNQSPMMRGSTGDRYSVKMEPSRNHTGHGSDHSLEGRGHASGLSSRKVLSRRWSPEMESFRGRIPARLESSRDRSPVRTERHQLPAYLSKAILGARAMIHQSKEERLRRLQRCSLKVKPFPAHCSAERIKGELQYVFGKYGPMSTVLYGSAGERCAVVSYQFDKDRDAAIAGTKRASMFDTEIEVTACEQDASSDRGDSARFENARRSSSISSSLLMSTNQPKPKSQGAKIGKEFRQVLSQPIMQNLKVTNFPVYCRTKQIKGFLKQVFYKYGQVNSINFSGIGEERYAIVAYHNTTTNVRYALAENQNLYYLNMKLEVTPWDDSLPSSSNGVLAQNPSSRVYISNLEKTVTPADLCSIFKRFGHILHSEIKEGPALYNYGFVQFNEFVKVSKVISRMNLKPFREKALRLGEKENLPSRCVWLYALRNTGFTEETLTLHFCQFGPLVKVVHAASKGTALVLYKDIDSAERAVDGLSDKVDGHIIKGKYADCRLLSKFFYFLMLAGESVGDLCRMFKETSEDESNMLTEAIGDTQLFAKAIEATQTFAEATEKLQALREASDEETQMLAEASDGESQMLAEGSDEEPQMLAEASDESC